MREPVQPSAPLSTNPPRMVNDSTTSSSSTATFVSFPSEDGDFTTARLPPGSPKRGKIPCWSNFDTKEIPPPFTRHADLWFSDGSVVLRAEETLFRVHMSQLSRHSVFFRDLFSLPQPASSDKLSNVDPSGVLSTVEGCPVLHLDDSAQDVANLLIALYDGPTFGNNDRNDFAVVSGILRLSTKYLVDALRAKSLAHLSIAWPSSLKCWDVREDRARMYELDTGQSRGLFYPSPIVCSFRPS